MSKNAQETIVNQASPKGYAGQDVEKTNTIPAPAVEKPSAVAKGYGETSNMVAAPVVQNTKTHLMKDLTRDEIRALSKEEKREYVILNKPRWREKAHTMVTGVFKNMENRGGGLTFNFPVFPGEDFKTWEFSDGGHYRIPYSVAVHLNDDCFYKEYQQVKGDFGQERVMNALHDGRAKANNMQMATKVYRYAFHSLEFSRDELSVNRSQLAEVYVSP